MYKCVGGMWNYVAVPSIMFGMNVMAWKGGSIEKLVVVQNRVDKTGLSDIMIAITHRHQELGTYNQYRDLYTSTSSTRGVLGRSVQRLCFIY
ncbi:hypothetical protein FHG87_021371 [Trinorchestia longiramus]|nr:hypothetical protein FHG87_021371 [Trinorchestia longiramus]